MELAVFTRFIQPNNNFFISAFAWNDYYRTIYRTNQALGRIPGITMDAGLKAQYIAESRFIRALMYFDLDSFFGNVPLILVEPTATTRVQQVTPAEVEAQVIADLQAAIPDLPVAYAAADLGRATKGAAQALLAKMYMQQHKYAEASALFTTIIGSGKYSLVPNYLDNFTDTNENNSESLFEVQYTGSVLDVGQGQTPPPRRATTGPTFLGPQSIRLLTCSPASGSQLLTLTQPWPLPREAQRSTASTPGAIFPSSAASTPTASTAKPSPSWATTPASSTGAST